MNSSPGKRMYGDYSEVTKGIANTYFKQWYRRKVWGGPSIERIPVSMKKFFVFLKEKKEFITKKCLGVSTLNYVFSETPAAFFFNLGVAGERNLLSNVSTKFFIL